MKLQDVINKIEQNQTKISSFGKFDDAILKKINYKLRLDWNYYSNRMEGGTLTKAETRSVMVGNIDVKGKPFKDVAEMTGHDKIVLEVLKMSKGELRIAEKRIKEIHKAIMHEEEAEKALQIGKWKSDPNEIINYKGEKISFTKPLEVAEEVHKLIDHTNAELDKFYAGKASKHPIEIAAQFHIDFVSVHPFYDGNGRTTRVLTNILLMTCGYPTVIIKDEHKKAYYRLLGDIQAYGGKVDLFYEFIAERVLETQQLIIDALEGKEIEELDDIDKEIQLFKKQVAAKDAVGTLKKDNKLVAELYFKSIKMLFEGIENKHQAFDDLFAENIYRRNINNSHPTDYKVDFLDTTIQGIIDETEKYKAYRDKEITNLEVLINHKAYQKDALNLFSVYHRVTVKFDDYQFHIGDNYMNKYSFIYSNLPNVDEIKEMTTKMIKSHFEEIKKKIKE
jgi:Fic family protein